MVISNSWGVGMTPGVRSNKPYILPVTANIWLWKPYIIIFVRFQVTIYNRVYDSSYKVQC